jgi:hypothetical protein
MLHSEEEARACCADASQHAGTRNETAMIAIVSFSPGFPLVVAGISSPLSLTESLY